MASRCTNCHEQPAEQLTHVVGVEHDGLDSRPQEVKEPLCEPCARAADIGIETGDWSKLREQAGFENSPAQNNLARIDDWTSKDVHTHPITEQARAQQRPPDGWTPPPCSFDHPEGRDASHNVRVVNGTNVERLDVCVDHGNAIGKVRTGQADPVEIAKQGGTHAQLKELTPVVTDPNARLHWKSYDEPDRLEIARDTLRRQQEQQRDRGIGR